MAFQQRSRSSSSSLPRQTPYFRSAPSLQSVPPANLSHLSYNNPTISPSLLHHQSSSLPSAPLPMSPTRQPLEPLQQQQHQQPQQAYSYPISPHQPSPARTKRPSLFITPPNAPRDSIKHTPKFPSPLRNSCSPPPAPTKVPNMTFPWGGKALPTTVQIRGEHRNRNTLGVHEAEKRSWSDSEEEEDIHSYVTFFSPPFSPNRSSLPSPPSRSIQPAVLPTPSLTPTLTIYPHPHLRHAQNALTPPSTPTHPQIPPPSKRVRYNPNLDNKTYPQQFYTHPTCNCGISLQNTPPYSLPTYPYPYPYPPSRYPSLGPLLSPTSPSFPSSIDNNPTQLLLTPVLTPLPCLDLDGAEREIQGGREEEVDWQAWISDEDWS